ncbi:asparagine synthetase B [Paradesertivirga mongoliensis]|uniref:Asparagine synthetase B n=1 Tax=Paradesertivirga mongoliensis TaxID=2100740 RepID=A0ABW4ZRH0_9SPHI
MFKGSFLFLLMVFKLNSWASSILIPMDAGQKNHLKAYGLAYWSLQNGIDTDWLLNYRNGSFLLKYSQTAEKECKIRGISYEVVTDGKANLIIGEIVDPNVNMELVKLEKAPKIAVYSPKNKIPSNTEDTDAVLLVLEYAEIPYDIIYDEEVMKGDLSKYDWLHLHHEDFTGQFGRSRRQTNFQEGVQIQQSLARKYGYQKVSLLKLAVTKAIRDFCLGGGFLFAMCSGADTFDIALAAEGVDICDDIYDGDGVDPDAQEKLDFSRTFAFRNFILNLNPYGGFSNIDVSRTRDVDYTNDFFTLFEFSAKSDIVPTMLTQDHEFVIKGFNGQTTAFRKDVLKPNVLVMAETKSANEARYIHGEFGNGQWTFYGGHDPEKSRGGGRGNIPTDLNLHPNSPGYRLILNNVLFPAARKKKQKT